MTDHPNAAAPAPAAAAAAAPPVPALPPLPVIPPEILKTTRLYELMLLFEPAEAQRTWEKLVDWAKGIVQERHGGFIMKVDQWAESRKLAYEVKGVRRGTYLIIYYRGKPTKQVDLERDFRLDEKVMRHMLIAHDKEEGLKAL